jgi:hypothetical protein
VELQIERRWFTKHSTIGELFIDGIRECYTLEDVVRPHGVKVKGQTAIPALRYEVVINFSHRHQRLMLQLLNVPNFEGVRMDVGNDDRDVEGCFCVGTGRSPDCVTGSLAAYGPVFAKVNEARLRGEKIHITIENLPANDSPLLPPTPPAEARAANA